MNKIFEFRSNKNGSYGGSNKFLLFIGFILTFVLIFDGVNCGSCTEATLCCTGRDSSCVVQKAPINAIIEDLSDKPCYCDHACLKLDDCCPDFKQHCKVIDCTVTDWGSWSECNTTCGTGMMTRSRSIINAPQNGGRHCPFLQQKRGCQGYNCHSHSDRSVLRESALLLPAELSKSRHENDTIDIRRNLRLRYRDSFKHNRNHEYCVEYEVIKATKPCHKIPPYNLLAEGDRTTVRCDLEALQYERTYEITNNSALQDDDQQQSHRFRCRGEGLPGRNTRWSALAAPSCHGKWLRLTVGQPRKCKNAKFIFI